MLCQCLLPHRLAESSVWLPSPRLVSHGNNKREKGGVIRAGWEQCSGKPSFESTFFSKPQTRLPKMKIDSQTKTLKLLKIQLNCLYLRGLLSGWGKAQRSATSPPKSPDVRQSFISSLGQKELSCPIPTHDACGHAHTHPKSSLHASDYLGIHTRTILPQSHFFFWRGGV